MPSVVLAMVRWGHTYHTLVCVSGKVRLIVFCLQLINCLDTVQFLIAQKANVCKADAVGSSVLTLCIARGDVDLARKLLEAGACTHPVLDPVSVWSSTSSAARLSRCERVPVSAMLPPKERHKASWNFLRRAETPSIQQCDKCGFNGALSHTELQTHLRALLKMPGRDAEQCGNPSMYVLPWLGWFDRHCFQVASTPGWLAPAVRCNRRLHGWHWTHRCGSRHAVAATR